MTSEGSDDHDDVRLAALRRYTILFDDEACSFEGVTRAVRAAIEVPMAAVSLVEFDHQWFKSPVGLGLERTPRAISFCSVAIRSGDPLVVADAADDPRFRDNPLVTGPPHLRAYLGMPLTTPDGFRIGVLCGLDTRPRRFSERDMAVMANLAAIVMDEIELRQAASVDALTGALVRGGLVRRIDRVVEDGTMPAALAILAVDRFERINEAHGHAAGEAVLAGLARHVMAWKRPADVLGRLGGEEFGLLMPGIETVDAVKRLETLRRVVERMGVDAPATIEATISVGLAPLLETIRTTGAWLHAADRALYEAKLYGRNRVVLGDGSAPAPAIPGGDRRRVRDLPVESEVLNPLEVMRWVNKTH